MQIGMVGLVRMGASMTDRLILGGHHYVVNVRDAAAVLSAALYARFSSRGEDDFANHALSAMHHDLVATSRKPSTTLTARHRNE